MTIVRSSGESTLSPRGGGRLWREGEETKRLFGFCVSIAHNSVSITHNSKYVGPTAEKSVWFLFLVFVFITQFFDF